MQEQVDYIEILNTLCHRGATWKTILEGELVNFKATFLKNDPLAWFLLMASIIITTGHSSDVNKYWAALVYSIVTGKTVDLGKIIQNSTCC